MTGFHFTGTAVHALPELRFPFFRIPGSLGLEYSAVSSFISSFSGMKPSLLRTPPRQITSTGEIEQSFR